eukprot:1152738-Pelagomonas_calceolata.AAC.1
MICELDIYTMLLLMCACIQIIGAEELVVALSSFCCARSSARLDGPIMDALFCPHSVARWQFKETGRGGEMPWLLKCSQENWIFIKAVFALGRLY